MFNEEKMSDPWKAEHLEIISPLMTFGNKFEGVAVFGYRFHLL